MSKQKRLSSIKLNRILKHFKGLNLIDWQESQCSITDNYRGTFESTINNLDIYFDWILHNDNKEVSVVPVHIYNNDKGFDYLISDFQFLELEKAAKELFNLEIEEFEHPSQHAYNLGD